jgi:hypothetical protein
MSGHSLSASRSDRKGVLSRHRLLCLTFLVFLAGAAALSLSAANGARQDLYTAAGSQPASVVRAAIAMGGDVNERCPWDNRTPLHAAAERGDCDLVELLLDKGAEPEAKDAWGWTALHVAAREARPAAAELLLERAPVLADIANDIGDLPIHVAAGGGRTEVMRTLLSARPDQFDAQGADGCTPLEDACRLGHPNAAILLLDTGAHVTADAVSSAARAGDTMVLWRLLEQVDERGRPEALARGLAAAMAAGRTQAAEMLTGYGAVPEPSDAQAEGPSARAQDAAMARVLPDAAPDPSAI